jgi:outer membrane lipopolysaccharide assembly protein LptE/RlpB
MDNYPPGAANDPDAPYNQPLAEPYEVTVSMTLSKTFTVDVLKHEDRLIDEADIRLQRFLPDEILKAVSGKDTEYKKLILNQMRNDASDWVVDDIAIVEE